MPNVWGIAWIASTYHQQEPTCCCDESIVQTEVEDADRNEVERKVNKKVLHVKLHTSSLLSVLIIL